MLKSSDIALLKKCEITEVSEQAQSISTTKTRLFLCFFWGELYSWHQSYAFMIVFCTIAMSTISSRNLAWERSARCLEMKIRVAAHHGNTQIPAWACSDRTLSIAVPLVALWEPKVDDNFQRFWWMESPLGRICVVCWMAKITPSVVAGCLSSVLGCSWDLWWP